MESTISENTELPTIRYIEKQSDDNNIVFDNEEQIILKKNSVNDNLSLINEDEITSNTTQPSSSSYFDSITGYLAISSLMNISAGSVYNFLRILGIFVILSYLGINFFGINFFGYVNDFIQKIFEIIIKTLSYFGYGSAEITKSLVSTSAKGAEEVVDITSKTAISGVDILEKSLSKRGTTMNKIDDDSKIDMNLLNKAVKNQLNYVRNDPQPDEAGSRTQSSKYRLKSGFCYIGEDRGFRRCIEVGEGDNCMSGDIFPTEDICVNPSLRE